MKVPVRRVSPEEIELAFPIFDRLEGWFFRAQEVSNGVWEVQGSDLFGRKVSRTGSDPDILLDRCTDDARAIATEVKKAEPVGMRRRRVAGNARA